MAAYTVSYAGWNGTAAAGDALAGIQVGTNNTAVVHNNYALGAKINHGTGAGQLSYGACTVDSLSVNGSVTSLRFKRIFTNNTAGTITVQEVGLVVKTYNTQYVLMCRDVVSPADIAPGASKAVYITIRMTA